MTDREQRWTMQAEGIAAAIILNSAAINVYVVYEVVYQHADGLAECASTGFIPSCSSYGRTQPQMEVSVETVSK